MARSDITALGLAALLGFAGIAHFVNPGFFDEIVPHALPGPPRELDLRERRRRARVRGRRRPAVDPPRGRARRRARVRRGVPGEHPDGGRLAVATGAASRPAAYGRLPLQIPLVLWALRVRRDARPVRSR